MQALGNDMSRLKSDCKLKLETEIAVRSLQMISLTGKSEATSTITPLWQIFTIGSWGGGKTGNLRWNKFNNLRIQVTSLKWQRHNSEYLIIKTKTSYICTRCDIFLQQNRLFHLLSEIKYTLYVSVCY